MELNKDSVIIICSRRESSRIFQKAFRKIAGVTAIEHILQRIQQSNIKTILAVPIGETQYYHQFTHNFKNVNIFEGNSESPLHRMKEAIFSLPEIPSYVIRITHDDILIDNQCMIDLIEVVHNAGAGYGISKGILEGAGVEVIRTENLIHAANNTAQSVEHISYFVKGAGLPNEFITYGYVRNNIRRPYRLVMDYEQDAILLETILRHLGPFATNDEICKFIDSNMRIMDINRLPLVTFYTCAYNAEKYIRQCIESVYMNGVYDSEYIITDDCSTDNTLTEILKSWDVGKFHLAVNETNLGLSSSSNIALSRARGRYILRIDADDILMPNTVKNMIAIMKEKGAGVVYPNYDIIDENSNTIFVNVKGSDHHHVGGTLFDKTLLNEVRFRDGLRHWDSIDIYKRMKNRFPISYYDEVGFLYRRHNNNISSPSQEREEIINTMRSEWEMKGIVDTITTIAPT